MNKMIAFFFNFLYGHVGPSIQATFSESLKSISTSQVMIQFLFVKYGATLFMRMMMMGSFSHEYGNIICLLFGSD